MNFVQLLLHKQIQNIYIDTSEYIGIEGENHIVVPEIILHIEDYALRISNLISLGPALASIDDLLGFHIVQIEDDAAQIKISTGEGKWFAIDLRNEAWVGPEALVLYGPNDLIVVWN
jgi:hypothetical protein